MANMNELMIDIETLGQEVDSVVISLGACFFDIEKGLIGPTFYYVIDFQDQLRRGRNVKADTLKFWMGQSGAAKKVFHEASQPTLQVLTMFKNWVNSNCPKSQVKPWGNGSVFDISIMEHLMFQYGIEYPWQFNNIMDFRTFRRFTGNGEKLVKSGIDHNALDDAKSQAMYVIKHARGRLVP